MDIFLYVGSASRATIRFYTTLDFYGDQLEGAFTEEF
jgi:hypothetical protein